MIPQLNEHGHQRVFGRTAAPQLAAGPLDEHLREIHQISGPIGQGVEALVPFPTSLPFTEDASINDLTISLSATNRGAVMLRYKTEHTFDAVSSMYTRAFADAGVELGAPTSPHSRLAVVCGQSAAATSSTTQTDASCRVSIDDHDASRVVRLVIDYNEFDCASFIEEHANWHCGAAPINDAMVDGFEVKTLDNAPRPNFSTLYTTRYRLPGTTLGKVRLEVESLLRNSGWTWLEPTTNVLYLDGPFDAETHIAQDGSDVMVDFVAEFGPFTTA